ncbi:ADP-dependent glucokinase-like [Tubulanus polymorphus]|uniref:ADP-dependent glucokinase-like n=1 Tax=Tubulanus polymorphus TaxID=672921 RepID=UPI003DA65E05
MPEMGSKLGLLLPAFLIIIAYFYKKDVRVNDKRLDEILQGLLRAENKPTLKPLAKMKVAVGFGACLDSFVNATTLLDIIDFQPPLSAEHKVYLSTQKDVEQMFAYFFKHGAAAERFVQNKDIWDKMVKAAKESAHTRWEFGGNAPVMANRFAMEGCNVLLGGRASTHLKGLLRPELKVIGKPLENDDIHLIMEYKHGDKWGEYWAPRANRFIVHHDESNPTLNSLEDFEPEMLKFSPNLLVIGGLQMMDHFPFKQGQRQDRLEKLAKFLSKVPKSTKIHFELASFTDESLLADLVKYVLPYCDSLGMNEQELPNLHSIMASSGVTLISDPYPRVATTLDHIRNVYKYMKKQTLSASQRVITRIHAHTLAYQAILTTKGTGWKNTMSAAAKAALTAHRHVCGEKNVDTAKARIIMDESFSTSKENIGTGKRIPLDVHKPVSCWDEDDYTICIAPVLVCTKVKQTAGGGDNISSAGLVLQL